MEIGVDADSTASYGSESPSDCEIARKIGGGRPRPLGVGSEPMIDSDWVRYAD